jgi:hypothetical protein
MAPGARLGSAWPALQPRPAAFREPLVDVFMLDESHGGRLRRNVRTAACRLTVAAAG